MESSDDEKEGKNEASIPKEVDHSSEPKRTKFVDEVLKGTNEGCLENFRMEKEAFYKLCNMLHGRGLLRHTNRIKIEEQLAIFMFIVGHNLRTRAVQELFRYSGETISRHFNNVLSAIMSVSLEMFQSPKPDVVPPAIREDPRFYPYFLNCVGAVDSVHFPVTVGVDEQGPFRNKNGFLSQNVLVACSFDMKFQYVLAGWEGSAPEMQLLDSALTRRYNLQLPQNKYYLVNTKFANIPGFIAPYPGVVSHTQLEDARELFNHRHSILHNVTGRSLAALKERFPILVSAPPYPLATQVKLVIAACALHNFIRDENPDDWIFKMYEQEAVLEIEQLSETQLLDVPIGDEEVERASQVIFIQRWWEPSPVGNWAARSICHQAHRHSIIIIYGVYYIFFFRKIYDRKRECIMYVLRKIVGLSTMERKIVGLSTMDSSKLLEFHYLRFRGPEFKICKENIYSLL